MIYREHYGFAEKHLCRLCLFVAINTAPSQNLAVPSQIGIFLRQILRTFGSQPHQGLPNKAQAAPAAAAPLEEI